MRRLVGGLVLRYLVSDPPPGVRSHAGTRDVDWSSTSNFWWTSTPTGGAVLSRRHALGTRHRETQQTAFAILRQRFATDPDGDGYTKDGPVAVARFEREDLRDVNQRFLRQRNVSTTVGQFLREIRR